MHDDDLFREAPLGPDADPWDMPEVKLRADLLEEMRARPLPTEDDLTCAIALTHLVRAELEAFGTNRQERLSDSEIALAQRTLGPYKAVANPVHCGAGMGIAARREARSSCGADGLFRAGTDIG